MYSQLDLRWRNLLLGYNTDRDYNLGNFGCLVTAYANIRKLVTGEEVNPAAINDRFKGWGGFTPGGGILYWSVVLRDGVLAAMGQANNIQVMRDFVAAGAANYAIMEVKTRAGGQHYVAVDKAGQIIDSSDGRIKADTTYTFVTARLYQATGGRGAGPAPVVTQQVGKVDPSMTDEQEKQAYRIILNRERDGAYSGRTGYQFITDAQSELSQQRTQKDSAITSLTNQVNDAEARATSAETTSATLRDSLAQMATTLQNEQAKASARPDFTASTRPDVRTRIAARAGVAKDFSGKGSDIPVKVGTVFHQAEVFVADGKFQCRTQRSVDAGAWYGTPEDLFDDQKTSTEGFELWLHTTGSTLWSRWRKSVGALNIFKRKENA